MAVVDRSSLGQGLVNAGFDADVLAALSGIRAETRADRPTETGGVDRELLIHAALSGTFLPGHLGAAPGSRPVRDLEGLLGLSETVVTPSGREWRLRTDARRDALASARSLGDMRQLIDRLPPARESDVAGAMLRRLLTGERLDPEVLSLGEIEGLIHAAEWVGGTGLQVDRPPEAALRRAKARRELLEPFLTLVGRTGGDLGGEGRDRFVGRESEIERLRSYVGVLPPERWPDSLRRGVDAVWSAIGAGPGRSEPLRIQGAGGAGKSTLIAKFVLEHARFMLADPERRTLRLPFVYIDFDRATLTAREPLQLLLDMSDQIQIWLPEIESELDGFRYGLRRTIDEQGRGGTKVRERETWSELRGYCAEFRRIVDSANGTAAPVVVFFDTFELVQYNSEAVAGVNGLIDSLRGAPGGTWDNLRIVVSGRGSLTEIGSKLRPLTLGPLSQRATRELITVRSRLEGLGLSQAQVETLAKPLAGSPLDVVVVTGWMKDNPAQAAEFVEEIAADPELRAEDGEPGSEGAEARVTALLVRRMIDHIATRAVRELAIPGFVVRAITPDVIREVMMPAGDEQGAAARARMLFERLRTERWLVYPHGPVLRHRAEVRRAMLRLIRKRDPEAFYRINERAVLFFLARLDGRVERAEAIYHLLLARPPRIEEADAIWRTDVAGILATGVEDLEGIARDYLHVRLGHNYSEAALASMPESVLRAVIASSASSVLDRIGAEAALRLAERRPGLVADRAGAALVAEARYRSGRWPDLAEEAVRSGALDRALRDIDALVARTRERSEPSQLSLFLRLCSRDASLDEAWRPVVSRLLGRMSSAEDLTQWEALAFAACWQSRNGTGGTLGASVPDALDVAARNCRRVARLPAEVRSSAALRVLALLEPVGGTSMIRNVDLRGPFATVGARELEVFRGMLDAAARAGAPDASSAEEFSVDLDAGRALVGSIQTSEKAIVLNPRLTAEMAGVAERLLVHRPEALASSVRRLLFVSHPDWIEPLGLALDLAYDGAVPTRLGWFSTIDDLLGEEAGRSRRQGRRSGGRQIASLADEAGHLLELVRAYGRHMEERRPEGDPGRFRYLAERLEAWARLLDPAAREAPIGPNPQTGALPTQARADQARAGRADDPQKHQWGGASERDGWRLEGTVKSSKSDRDWFRIDLRVAATGGKELSGPVVFHLHDSFPDPVREIEPRSSSEARLKLWAYGAFTVGALVAQDGTTLELDLVDVPDAPKRFRSR